MPPLPACPRGARADAVSEAPSGRVLICDDCNRTFPFPVKKRSAAGRGGSTRARSHRQESHNARAVGGRLTVNSGAGRDKGDVKLPGRLREEDKTTLKASYVLKLDDLRKLQAAAQGDEMPIMRIAFGDDLRSQFVVIQSEWFNHLFKHYLGHT